MYSGNWLKRRYKNIFVCLQKQEMKFLLVFKKNPQLNVKKTFYFLHLNQWFDVNTFLLESGQESKIC